MHWTEKRTAVANIGRELRRLGWTLWGWKDDESDPMTDYYSPASWQGIATHPDHPGTVVAVNVSDYLVDRNSGDQGWPVFQANPPHKTWHVEKEGQIIVSGVGLKGCRSVRREEYLPAVERLIARIEGALATRGADAQAETGYNPGVAVTEWKGHPILELPLLSGQAGNGGRSFRFGSSKARAILRYLEDIERFVEVNDQLSS